MPIVRPEAVMFNSGKQALARIFRTGGPEARRANRNFIGQSAIFEGPMTAYVRGLRYYLIHTGA